MKFHQIIRSIFGEEIEELFLLGDYSANSKMIENLISHLDNQVISEINLLNKLPVFNFEEKEYTFGSIFEVLAHNDFIIWHNFLQTCVFYVRKFQELQGEELSIPNNERIYDSLMEMLQFDQFPVNMTNFNDILVHLKQVAPNISELFNEFKKFRFGEWNAVAQNPAIPPKKKYKKIAAYIVTLVSTNVGYFTNFSVKTFKGSVKEFLIKKQQIEEAFVSSQAIIIFMIQSTRDFRVKQLT